ncbi:MAG: hydroxymethylglutaryl-CoA lyase [Ketobacteraceae bacterium]|nr:hydroxymethylglutaryl-CoA lyase [Ketobacteraceae bacterium]
MTDNKVIITETGMRDGLQNQPTQVPASDKLRLAEALISAGVTHLEATSFVHPRAVPQMADASEVLAGLKDYENLDVSVLVPNVKGYEKARDHQVTSIGIVCATTDAFNQRNLNMTTEQVKAVCSDILTAARQDGIRVRVYVSGAFACPYDGKIPVQAARDMAAFFIGKGADSISIADTIGAGNPRQVQDILKPLIAEHGAEMFNLHLHDTRGQALAMAWSGLELGIRSFDASVGGLGGCPFAPGASGNVATEDLVYMCEESGLDTGIDWVRLREAVKVAEEATGRTLGGRILTWLKSQEEREAARQPSCNS